MSKGEKVALMLPMLDEKRFDDLDGDMAELSLSPAEVGSRIDPVCEILAIMPAILAGFYSFKVSKAQERAPPPRDVDSPDP